MDTWRPVSTAYGACSNTERSNHWDSAVSAIGNESSAGAFIGKHHWISVIRSWLWAGSGARRRRGGRRWAWRYLDGGIDGDLALLLAVRSQHDGIDWDRLTDPVGLIEPTGPSELTGHPAGPTRPPGPSQLTAHSDPAARGQYDGIDWDCARDPGERVP